MNLARLFPLACGVQHYAWGQRHHAHRQPFIASLLGVKTAENQPFAELWIGAHPKLPSRVPPEVYRNGDLSAFLQTAPRQLLDLDGRLRQLPFLLKVLSSGEPLSIQAHPDRALARRLHAKAPELYPDANHKPEIAIAVTDFDVMARFRSTTAIRRDLQRLPALRAFFPPQLLAIRAGSAWLRAAYAWIFKASAEQVTATLVRLRRELPSGMAATCHDRVFRKVVRLHAHDRGCLSVYFLNILRLKPGEAIFIGPNEPHAYLGGTALECMANSDNVVRAGLTPKHSDAAVLLKMLSYRQGPLPLLNVQRPQPQVRTYVPPVEEFRVSTLQGNARTRLTLGAERMLSLLLVLRGKATATAGDTAWELPRGSIWLWPACLPELSLCLQAADTCIVRAQPNLQPRPV